MHNNAQTLCVACVRFKQPLAISRTRQTYGRTGTVACRELSVGVGDTQFKNICLLDILFEYTALINDDITENLRVKSDTVN